MALNTVNLTLTQTFLPTLYARRTITKRKIVPICSLKSNVFASYRYCCISCCYPFSRFETCQCRFLKITQKYVNLIGWITIKIYKEFCFFLINNVFSVHSITI
jgi:hypothetical protein